MSAQIVQIMYIDGIVYPKSNFAYKLDCYHLCYIAALDTFHYKYVLRMIWAVSTARQLCASLHSISEYQINYHRAIEYSF
jgi:hypothetical protein